MLVNLSVVVAFVILAISKVHQRLCLQYTHDLGLSFTADACLQHQLYGMPTVPLYTGTCQFYGGQRHN